MTSETKTKEYIVDARNKPLGRVATEVAMILRGKNEPSFEPHKLAPVKVIVENASQVALNDSQLEKEYKRYSGYPGGLKFESRDHLIARRGYREVFERAVYGMLPNNKLRALMMKNLTIKE